MQATVHRDYGNSYMPPPSYGGYRGSGPEWDKLAEAERKGISGYLEVQALMASSDTQVAEQACMYLVRKDTDETFALLFEKLPSVDQAVKDSLRSASYRYTVVAAAAEAVKARDEKTKEGAITFLNLCYMRDYGGANDRDAAFKTIVSAIPDYTGADADKLT
jgi:hypothetical protein